VKVITLQEAWEGKENCINCSIRDSALFSGLNICDFEFLHNPIDQFTLPAGSTLYHIANDANYLYTIRSGIIKLQQSLPDGNQRIVRLGFKADTIGLEALLEPGYNHDAVALSDIQVCRIPVPAVNELSNQNPELYKELISRWNMALNDADNWITKLSTGSVKQRMANLLLKLADKFDTNKCKLFSREDIGFILGVTTETASRTIAEFKRNNLLIKQGDEYIFDLKKIESIVRS